MRSEGSQGSQSLRAAGLGNPGARPSTSSDRTLQPKRLELYDSVWNAETMRGAGPGERGGSVAVDMAGPELQLGVGWAGFENSIESISKLPQDLFAEVCQQIMLYLQCKTPGVNTLELVERLQNAGVELDAEATKEIVHVISLIFRAAAQSSMSAEELVTKLAGSSSKWSKQALQAIRHVWNEQGKLVVTAEDAKHMLTVGQLVDLQWKLGMAMSSDGCRSLNYLYVTMVLKVANPSGDIIRRSFEMTIPQFQNFSKQFRELAAVLEMV
ncbi:COMM domain-containing protein 6 isoform X2 [Leucoraja erinacea]|uniref:COMM domain-containing protein 6 isoform X2 n=1 Tax=Leucoraja erinaceus TaxID=7782 RepID=UPI002458E48E|nr:COMM domain-containing protein 6 isoform X2 [Leucoraja erinacea]